MGTAFSAGLNGNDSFDWVEWERLFRLDWMRTAFSYGLQLGGQRSWVISAQLNGQRSWVVNEAGWSTQLDDQRSWMITQVSDRRRWVVDTDGWSAQLDDLFFGDASSLAADACPDRGKRGGKRGFYSIRLADVNLTEVWCQDNRRWCQGSRGSCQNIIII